MWTAARRLTRPTLHWLMSRAARAYVAGDRLHNAVRVRDRLARRGLGATLGFWNDRQDTPRRVADEYLACIRCCSAGDYVSIKLPAIDHSRVLFDELMAAAVTRAVPLHFDAMQPDTASRLRSFVEALPDAARARIGVTLPACWQRSAGDAGWAAESGLPVRIVKGQWPDPDCPQIDLRAGFLRLVDVLADRGVRVAVATHDAPLARAALQRLRGRAAPMEVELLYGLPRRAVLRVASGSAVAARIYVGYGFAFVPYAAGRMLDDPRRLVWLLRDAVGLGAG